MEIVKKVDMFGVEIVDDFRGKYFFLSNFYVRDLVMYGITFPSSEHAYMWHKTVIVTERDAILSCKTPRDARLRGGPDFTTLRPEWNLIRVPSMLAVLRAKYEQNPDLKSRLVATGDSLLIEGNMWCDNFWGDCYCEDCKHKPGLNHLGKCHEFLRHEFQNDNL